MFFIIRCCLITMIIMTGTQCLAQQQLSRIVIDSLTRQPVAFAAVGIAGTSRGVAANELGEFVLRYSGSDSCSFMISAIGYHSKMFSCSDAASDTILLSPSILLLDELTVLSKQIDAAKFVRSAFDKIPENYLSAPVTFRTFYRYTRRVNGKLSRFSEAAIDLYKRKGYSRTEEPDRFRINEVRRSMELNPSGHGNDNYIRTLMNADIIKSRTAEEYLPFLSFVMKGRLDLPNESAHFRFDLKKIVMTDSIPTYVISFIGRTLTDRIGYEGTLYIDPNTYAILRFEATNTNHSKTPFQYSRKVLAEYRKVSEKYIPSYLRSELTTRYTSEDSTGTSSRIGELLINEALIGKNKSVTAKEISQTDLILTDYNHEFWTNYNVVKANPLDTEDIAAFQQTDDWSRQFVEKQQQDRTEAANILAAIETYERFMTDNRDVPMAIIYWASWSAQSRADLMEFSSKAENLLAGGMKFIFISADNIPANYKKWKEKLGLPPANTIRIGRSGDFFKDKDLRPGIAPAYRIMYKGKMYYDGTASPGSKAFDEVARSVLLKYHKKRKS